MRRQSTSKWKTEAARLEAETKADIEKDLKYFEQTVVLDTAADGTEIALLGGPKNAVYSKVADPKKLRLFVANMKALTQKVIRELKESKKLSESSQKELDALANLTPEQYGMTK